MHARERFDNTRLAPECVRTDQKWQVASVGKPLLSVGEECDKDQSVSTYHDVTITVVVNPVQVLQT